MKAISIKFIQKQNIEIALPLLQELNRFTDQTILKARLKEMSNQHYKCLGIFKNQELIGICGLWFLTRHYCGNTIEPDHVIITKNYRNNGIGKILFKWIYEYAEKNNIEAIELNTYIENIKSHRFYENEGFKKLGFHYLKKL
ncbi:MAG: GNAT family N-acetyltransferase [Lutibacter sp.]